MTTPLRDKTSSKPLAVDPDEAAAMLSLSRDSFDRYVRPELRLVYVGRRRLVPIAELQRYLDEHAVRVP